MPRFEKATAEVSGIVDRMMDRYHPQLRDAGVTITCLMAFPTTDKNGDNSGPPLKHQGYPALAIVKVIGLKERTDGRSDAEICIDGDAWLLRSEAEKDALVDHELEHLELKTDKNGALVRDDLERPKLKLRRHDFQAGFFDSIVRRHGRAAPEWSHYETFRTVHYEQRWLPYLDSPDTTPVIARQAVELSGEKLDTSDVQNFNERNSPVEDVTVPIRKPRSKKPSGGARGGRRRMAMA